MTFRFFVFVSGLLIAVMGFMLATAAPLVVTQAMGWAFFALGLIFCVLSLYDDGGGID